MVAAQVRGARQRADKHSKVPRELPDLILPPDGICTRHIISHDLSVPVHARQVSLLTGRGRHCNDLLAALRAPPLPPIASTMCVTAAVRAIRPVPTVRGGASE